MVYILIDDFVESLFIIILIPSSMNVEVITTYVLSVFLTIPCKVDQLPANPFRITYMHVFIVVAVEFLSVTVKKINN